MPEFCPSFLGYRIVMLTYKEHGLMPFLVDCYSVFFYSMYNVRGPGSIFRVLFEVVRHYEIHACLDFLLLSLYT